MSELTIWTYDWVPEGPRGFVRDLRLRWACEEAGLTYAVGTILRWSRDQSSGASAIWPSPVLAGRRTGDIRKRRWTAASGPKKRQADAADPVGAAETLQWTIAALNSIEMVTVPWWFLKMTGAENEGLTAWMGKRLDQLERVLSEQEWLAAERFTVADLLMADVLRVSDVRSFGDRPATEAYVARVTGRTAFKKAQADQIGHFEAADQKRAEERSN